MKHTTLLFGCVLLLSGINAHATVALSDRLLITDSSAANVFDQLIPELDVENPLLYGPPFASLEEIAPFVTHVVVVIEPLGETPNPGVIPVLLPNPADPTHPFIVSDAIARFSQPGDPNFRILFGSDGDPFLQLGFDLLSQLHPVVSVIGETGELQDVTDLLGLTGSGITVQFQSDVAPVPLPATLWLFGSVLGGLGLWRRRGG